MKFVFVKFELQAPVTSKHCIINLFLSWFLEILDYTLFPFNNGVRQYYVKLDQWYSDLLHQSWSNFPSKPLAVMALYNYEKNL